MAYSNSSGNNGFQSYRYRPIGMTGSTGEPGGQVRFGLYSFRNAAWEGLAQSLMLSPDQSINCEKALKCRSFFAVVTERTLP